MQSWMNLLVSDVERRNRERKKKLNAVPPMPPPRQTKEETKKEEIKNENSTSMTIPRSQSAKSPVRTSPIVNSPTGPKIGSGGLKEQTVTNDITIRNKGFGHFMNDVRNFVNRDIRNIETSKSELFQPEPSKRNAENIDPLSEQIDIVPYWQTNGLENIGILPPSMTTSNGTFNKPITTNPQKFVFMTYKSGMNNFYNCKLPMKVNIPSGDFGIYKVTVNEVLFRTDMDLLDVNDYITFSFNLEDMEIADGVLKDGALEDVKIVPNPLKGKFFMTIRISDIFKDEKNIHFNHLNIDLLIEVINAMISKSNIELSVTDPYNSPNTIKIPLYKFLLVEKDILGGVGLYFKLRNCRISEDLINKRQAYLMLSTVILTLNTCSSNFRHIFPPLQTTTSITAERHVFCRQQIQGFDISYSIYIPRCNFAGPQLILFNSSAQTTCPISNEYAKQFNTCALSYNTNEDTNSLIQMTSNVELTMKNTNEFRVWLTDNYGEPIKIQSPIYVQVTVQPFVNETSTAMNE